MFVEENKAEAEKSTFRYFTKIDFHFTASKLILALCFEQLIKLKI